MRLYVLLAAAGLFTTAVAGEDSLPLPPGQTALYEGTVKLQQSAGEGDSSETVFRATLACRLREASPGKLQVLAVRLLRPAEGPQDPLAAIDEAAVTHSEAGFQLEPAGESAAELEESAQQLGIFLPLEVLPAFRAPDSGEEARSEAEVSVLGLARAKAPFVATARKDGGRVESTRKLAPGAKVAFDFRGDKASIAAWSELYVTDAAGGLPRRIEKTVAMQVEMADGKMRLEKTLTLEAKKLGVPAGEEAAKLEAVDKELRGVGADFGALKPPEEIAKRIEALGKLAKGTALEAASEALSIRLGAYRSAGLGKSAPDFTLESLEGKQVSFRDATKGKVTLLSFWGVG